MPNELAKGEAKCLNGDIVLVDAGPSGGSAVRRLEPQFRLRLWAFSVVVAGLTALSCGTPATLHITAPSKVEAGVPFAVTVNAMVGGSRDTVINSAIHFTSSDRSAVLPPDYYFTANDAGSHTFSNGVILNTSGPQSITATAIGAQGLNGTANILVSAPATAIRTH